jgi:hypothetical protein
MRLSREWFALVLATVVASCGAGDAGTAEESTAADDQSAGAEPAPPAPAVPGESATAPIKVEDIDRWQRGLAGELEAVQEAGRRFREARTGTDSVNAAAGALDMATVGAGARAAGLSEDRYQFVRSTLSTAVGYLSPIEQEMDVSQMPATMVEEMKKSRETSLAQMSNEVPNEVVEALRPRAAELRKQDLGLTVERLKAIGEAR